MCHEQWRPQARTAQSEPEVVSIQVVGGAMTAYHYRQTVIRPASTPVVVLTDIYGCVPFYHEIARLLAANGHPALLPDLFSREGALRQVSREEAYARHGRMDEQRAIDDVLRAV